MSSFNGDVAFGWQTWQIHCVVICVLERQTHTHMHTKAQDFLHASVALSHPHSSESPVSTSSSSPKRSELITVSDGVYSFPLSHQRHSHQVDCQSGWMSRTCQNHISKISFLLLSKRRGPSSHFSLWMYFFFSCFFLLHIKHKYTVRMHTSNHGFLHCSSACLHFWFACRWGEESMGWDFP